MKKLRFKVKLIGQPGSSVAALNAPFDVKEVFGTIARVPVRGTINGFPFRSSLMPMGGCHFMAVNRTMREGADVKAGDTVTVVMERDTAPRVVAVPAVLKTALAKSKTAQANWKKYSFSSQKEMAVSITGAKQEETRVRRVARIIDIVKTGKRCTMSRQASSRQRKPTRKRNSQGGDRRTLTRSCAMPPRLAPHRFLETARHPAARNPPHAATHARAFSRVTPPRASTLIGCSQAVRRPPSPTGDEPCFSNTGAKTAKSAPSAAARATSAGE